MWHYPTAGQKNSKGAVFQKEREVPRGDGRFREEQEVSEARFSEGVLRGCFGGASGVLRGCFGGASGVFQRKCLEGDALGCSGMLWDALGCSGMLWDALGCSGMLWDALGCFGDASGVFRKIKGNKENTIK